MNVKEVLRELESYADERTKNTHMKHGAQEPLFGVKVADLKKILKKRKRTTNFLWPFTKQEIQMPCTLPA